MSDVGRVRRGNEDNYLLLDLATPRMWHRLDGDESPQEMRQFTLGEKGLVLVVSDGMGGALAGDVASKMAIEAVRDVLLGNNSEGPQCDPDSAQGGDATERDLPSESGDQSGGHTINPGQIDAHHRLKVSLYYPKGTTRKSGRPGVFTAPPL